MLLYNLYIHMVIQVKDIKLIGVEDADKANRH